MIYFVATLLMFTFFMVVVTMAKTKKRPVRVRTSCHNPGSCCSKK